MDENKWKKKKTIVISAIKFPSSFNVFSTLFLDFLIIEYSLINSVQLNITLKGYANAHELFCYQMAICLYSSLFLALHFLCDKNGSLNYKTLTS